jgi:hypothetical protein
LVDTYARSKFEDTRRKAQKFGARGTTLKAYKPVRELNRDMTQAGQAAAAGG